MKQPKSAAELLALPIRSFLNYVWATDLRHRCPMRVPVAKLGYAVQYEPDTVFFARDMEGNGYMLTQDEDGYYRQLVHV